MTLWSCAEEGRERRINCFSTVRTVIKFRLLTPTLLRLCEINLWTCPHFCCLLRLCGRQGGLNNLQQRQWLVFGQQPGHAAPGCWARLRLSNLTFNALYQKEPLKLCMYIELPLEGMKPMYFGSSFRARDPSAIHKLGEFKSFQREGGFFDQWCWPAGLESQAVGVEILGPRAGSDNSVPLTLNTMYILPLGLWTLG